MHNLQPQRHVLPKCRDRWVLVHYRASGDPCHIDSVMERSFGTRFGYLEGTSPGSPLTATELSSFLANRPEVAALSGFLRYSKPSIPSVVVFDVLYFEDPLERLWSIYKRQCRREMAAADNPDHAVTCADARSYFAGLLNERPEAINDVQVRLLANRDEYARPPSEADLEAARDALPGISVLGVEELFEESALTAENFLRPTFPALQFHYAGRDCCPSHQARRYKDDFRNSVGDAIYAALERLNELDSELVAAARKEVLRRFAMLRNPNVRRRSFRERCDAFESSLSAEPIPPPRAWGEPVDRAPNRPVLLHYHIFKNAGSTIEYVLDRAFGPKLASVHGPDPDSFLDAAATGSFVASHPELSAVTSHHFLYPKPVIPEVAVFDLCFFRDPLQRLWSMYKYFRRAEPVDDVGRAAKEMDARSFFELLISEHPQLVNSFQVNLLANGGRYTRLLTKADLDVALDTLSRISILGVVGLFDRSAATAEYFLQSAFPALRFEYVKVNADPSADARRQSKRDEFRRRVGEKVYVRLQRLNELDTALVAAARREVLRRWALVPDREERLAEFRQRCRNLQAIHRDEAMALLEPDRQDPPLSPIIVASTANPPSELVQP